MLDYIYLHEKPLPNNIKEIARLLILNECLTDVEQVLNEFFNLVEQGWINVRALSEIELYNERLEKASKAGKASAESRKNKIKQSLKEAQQAFNGRSTDVQQAFNQTRNKKQETRNNISASLDDIKDTKTEIDICNIVLNHLNEKANRQYRPTKSNTELIKLRLKEGCSKEDLLKVIDSKCSQWLMDGKMNQYLRPATLFNATKFSQYIGELTSNKPVNKDLEGML